MKRPKKPAAYKDPKTKAERMTDEPAQYRTAGTMVATEENDRSKTQQDDAPEHPTEDDSYIDSEDADDPSTFSEASRARSELPREWMRKVIDELKRSGNRRIAAMAGNVTVRICDMWRVKHEGFRDAYDEARDGHVDDIEQTVLGAAKAGDARLAEFVLKSRKRSEYGEKLDVSVSGTVGHIHTTAEELSRIATERAAGITDAMQRFSQLRHRLQE